MSSLTSSASTGEFFSLNPSRSVNPDQADGNMIIEGENLETLKLLLNAENVASLRRYIEAKAAAFFLTLSADGEQALFDEVFLKTACRSVTPAAAATICQQHQHDRCAWAPHASNP